MTRQQGAFIAIGAGLGALLLFAVVTRTWPPLVSFMSRHGLHTRFHCWVRVVNQEGAAVANYKCRVIIRGASFLPSLGGRTVVRDLTTNQDGYFEFSFWRHFDIVFFGQWDSQWRLNPGQLMQTQNIGVTFTEHLVAVEKDPVRFLGSRENPYVIHVFSAGPPQKLLYWEKRVELKETGNYACVDLLSGRVWESATPQGHVALADGLGTPTSPAPCSIIVKAGVGCALCPVVDDWGLSPPVNEYLSELCWDMDWQERRRWTYNTIQFYYRIESPQKERELYGRLSLGLSPRVSGANMQSFTNLQGERNLFYKGYADLGNNHAIQDYVLPPVHVQQR
jgi:hypothetical protein